ncbi:hypothetical protein U1Q18_022714 [Sarracenia purpurea var. burkii]
MRDLKDGMLATINSVAHDIRKGNQDFQSKVTTMLTNFEARLEEGYTDMPRLQGTQKFKGQVQLKTVKAGEPSSIPSFALWYHAPYFGLTESLWLLVLLLGWQEADGSNEIPPSSMAPFFVLRDQFPYSSVSFQNCVQVHLTIEIWAAEGIVDMLRESMDKDGKLHTVYDKTGIRVGADPHLSRADDTNVLWAKWGRITVTAALGCLFGILANLVYLSGALPRDGIDAGVFNLLLLLRVRRGSRRRESQSARWSQVNVQTNLARRRVGGITTGWKGYWKKTLMAFVAYCVGPYQRLEVEGIAFNDSILCLPKPSIGLRGALLQCPKLQSERGLVKGIDDKRMVALRTLLIRLVSTAVMGKKIPPNNTRFHEGQVGTEREVTVILTSMADTSAGITVFQTSTSVVETTLVVETFMETIVPAVEVPAADMMPSVIISMVEVPKPVVEMMPRTVEVPMVEMLPVTRFVVEVPVVETMQWWRLLL